MLAIQFHQLFLERVGLFFHCHKLLLCQLHLVPGPLFTILRADVGSANNLGRLLLGFADHILAQALRIDHACAEGILIRTVLVNPLGKDHELFLHFVVVGRQLIHAVSHLLEVIVHIFAAVTTHGAVKGHAAHILRSNHPYSSCFRPWARSGF